MNNQNKNIINDLAFIYIHFCSSTDHLLSFDEINLIGKKINDAINSDEDNYKETFRVISEIIISYNRSDISARQKNYNKVIYRLKDVLSDHQKELTLINLKELSIIDGVNKEEVDFINFLNSQW